MNHPKLACVLIILVLGCAMPAASLASDEEIRPVGGEGTELSADLSVDAGLASGSDVCSDPLAALIAADTMYDCCERHLDMCSNICNCGLDGFQCFDNGHGGCASRCIGCKVCV